jgi:hypothetical protein
MEQLNKTAVILIGFGLLVILGYFIQFPNGFSNDQSTWGAFGDLFGGILNPLISLVTLLAVFKTIVLTKQQSSISQFFELLKLHLERKDEMQVDSFSGYSAIENLLEKVKEIHMSAPMINFL